jgi:MFS family permease
MRRFGRGCLIAGTVASGLTVAVFPWAGSPFGSFLLRLLNGIAGAMSLIPLETLVNRNSAPDQRARDFGYYAFCVGLGIALGTAIGMQIYPSAPRLAFVLGGALALLAGAIVLIWLDLPEMPQERKQEAPVSVRGNLLSFGSAWSQGFLEGGMVALLPIYLLALAFTEPAVGWLMGGIMISVILFQLPVAWLADRLGRTMVLLGCYAVTSITLTALYFGLDSVGLSICLFLAGACSSAFYPLGLAIVGERVPPSGLARASAWYLAINCLGSVMGPVVAGAAMDRWGKQAIFIAATMAVLLVLFTCAGFRSYEVARRLTSVRIGRSPIAEREAA